MLDEVSYLTTFELCSLRCYQNTCLNNDGDLCGRDSDCISSSCTKQTGDINSGGRCRPSGGLGSHCTGLSQTNAPLSKADRCNYLLRYLLYWLQLHRRLLQDTYGGTCKSIRTAQSADKLIHLKIRASMGNVSKLLAHSVWQRLSALPGSVTARAFRLLAV